MVLFDMTPIEVEPTREEIEAARTESGWTCRQLARWGVASPSCGHPVLLAVVVAAGFADKPQATPSPENTFIRVQFRGMLFYALVQ